MAGYTQSIGRVRTKNGLAPASWQRCSLARVGHFGEVRRLRSSAWDRPRTASRTSAGAGLVWLVGRFAGSPRLKRGRKAGAGGGEGAGLRLGRWAAHFGVADGRRSGRGGAGRRFTAAAAVFVRAARGGAARGAGGAARGSATRCAPFPRLPSPPRFGPRAGQCAGWFWGVCGGRAGAARAQGSGVGAADPAIAANSARFLLLLLAHRPEAAGCDGGEGAGVRG